ncbi:DUF2561 family protein [Mycolicibacterium thermoresistibile]
MDSGHTRFDNIDRILMGVCAALWLAALGAAVAATVALVDLGRGRPAPAEDADTPWLLYSVIAVSALVIIAAVPLLLRARRSADDDAEAAGPVGVPAGAGRGPGAQPGRAAAGPAGSFGPAADPGVRRAGVPPTAGRGRTLPVAAIDQVWLRAALALGCAIGAATLLIGVATYLMAVDMNGAAWGCYVVAGLITVAMPVIPWWFLRELHELVDDEF